MKAVLEFDLFDPSEEKAFRRASSATAAYLVLYDMAEEFRKTIKYSDDEQAVQEARTFSDIFFELLEERNINLSDLE
jgi:hypothetical protein